VCINFGDETGDAPDLKIIQDGGTNPAATFDAPNADGTEIQTKDKTNSATVTITSYDWGAWGKIKACCVDEEGNECEFTELKNIPIDDQPAGGNHIADSWQSGSAGQAATWDDDGFPSGMQRNGDGFTFYEEYRGAMSGTSAPYTDHERLDPGHKNLFLYDPDDLHLWGHSGHQYGLLTSILISYLDADPAKLMNGTGTRASGHREVTWKSEFSHSHDQYALHIHRETLDGQGSWGYTPPDPDGAPIGPPNTALAVQIDDAQVGTDLSNAVTEQGGDPAGAEQAAFEDVRDRQITTTMTHEMGHATDVNHHNSGAGGRQSPYGDQYSGEIMCVMRYDFDLVDKAIPGHLTMYGARDLARSPDPPPPPGTPARFKFSNYTDKDLSDLTPVLNTFCTSDNNCKGQIDVKDP
jgi:hypothetical protein